MKLFVPARAVPWLALLAHVTLALSACNPEVEFDVPAEGDAEIEGASFVENLVGDFGFDGFGRVDVSGTQEFKSNDVRKNQVTEARATLIQLTVSNPSDANFDFVNTIAFSIEAPGVEKKEVAKKTMPKGATTVDLDIDDLDLSPYVRAESFSITSDANAQRPPEDTTLHAKLVMHVKAEVFAEGSADAGQ